MKKINKVLIIIFGIAFTFGLAGPISALAATAPALSDMANFAVLGATTVTNTGSSVLNGDLGLYGGTSITGFFGTTANEGPGVVSAGYAVHQTDATANLAQTAAANAYNLMASQPCGDNDLSGQNLGGQTLIPGVYCFDSTAQLTGTLTLNALGNSNAVWIFQVGTALTIDNNASVIITNGGTGTPGCNVYWQVGSAATIGTNATFIGTVIANSEAITLNTGATMYGRAISMAAAVTLDTNTITVPTCAIPVNGVCGTAVQTYPYTATGFGSDTFCSAGTSPNPNPTFPTADNPVTWACTGINNGSSDTCTASISSAPSATSTLTLVKTIIGGTRTFADFPLTATGLTTITGVYPASAITNATVLAGAYTLSEITHSDYTAEPWSCIKNPGSIITTGVSITLAAGDSAICTIQNTYKTPVTPPASSGGGGTYYSPIPPLIDVVKVPNPLALPDGPGTVIYTYTLRNIGTVSVAYMTMVGDTCSPITLISGDTNADARLDVDETWVYTCSTTLTKTHTNIVTATGWANGISATDIANATVIVGVPVVPPLIHVTKIPSPLVLSAGGGMVTYTNKVTNPGTAALSNVRLTDDKCSSVKYIAGDTNGNSMLDITETWTYTCSANLAKTTVNTVTASGEANGLTARDFAIATVVVSATVPKLPNTGLPSGEDNIPWNVIIPTGIFGALIIFYFARGKQTA